MVCAKEFLISFVSDVPFFRGARSLTLGFSRCRCGIVFVAARLALPVLLTNQTYSQSG